MNVISALAVGSIFHDSLSPAERLENAISAYLCLDLGKIIADEKAEKAGLNRNSMWLSPQTHENMQSLCGLVSSQVMGLPGDLPWCPWRSSELPLEQWFGSLRCQYASSQMRARDYMHAATKCMYRSQRRFKDGCQAHPGLADCPQPVSEEEFTDCAKKALSSALKLMACSCESFG